LSTIDQKLRFAHFRLLGISQLYAGPFSPSDILSKMFDTAYVDAQFKVARKHRKGGIEKFSEALFGSRKMPSNLKGTFGFLVSVREGKFIWGRSRVGASPKARKWLQEQHNTSLVPVEGNDVSVRMFGASPDAENHSECLLLNALGNFIGASDKNVISSDVDGHVTLFTELSPCESCTSVIEKFLSHYPKISVLVAYALEYPYDPKILGAILKARKGSALQQFNGKAATGVTHWERIR
jgi:hypothetical protein